MTPPLSGFNDPVEDAPSWPIPASDIAMADKPIPPPQPQTVQIQLELDAATANGVFINSAFVNHTDTEFTLDLIYVQPQPPGPPGTNLKATVRARAITTPKHMKRLLLAIQDNLAKYEARFGPVDLGDTPHFPPAGPVN